MGARVLGLVIFMILCAGWYYIEIGDLLGFILVLLGCYLAVSISMFLVQVILALIIFSLSFGHLEFCITCVISFCLMFATNFGGTRDLIQWKIAH